MNITLAILSWGAHKTLLNTLKSYDESKLLNMVNEKLIYFQEISPEDIEIAKAYGFDYEGNSRNIGISGGYSNLLNRATNENFLFLENDWECIEPPNTVAEQIGMAAGLLDSGVVDLVRLRHRRQPGSPLWTLQFAGREYDRPTHLLDCVHWELHPEKFNEITELLPNVYITSAHNANWTNNPHMARTAFLRNTIDIRMHPINDIERDIQPWWEQQEFTVAQSNGLFTHNRIG